MFRRHFLKFLSMLPFVDPQRIFITRLGDPGDWDYSPEFGQRQLECDRGRKRSDQPMNPCGLPPK
jgi:hypothetical protein